jgi:hypothetical protein
MYAEFKMKTVLQFWQKAYCDAEFERCERYKLSIDGKPVPINLLPNGKIMIAKGGG